MLSALAGADTIIWISICIKALVYATTLLAAGSILSILTLHSLPVAERRTLKWTAIICAVTAALLSLSRLPLRASFLMGGTWQGAMDPMILTMVADSPLGTSIALRAVGLLLICAILVPGRAGRAMALFGVGCVAVSFVFRGHALQEPRLALAILITLHLLALAFWVGAFLPLYRLAGKASGQQAALAAHDFGTKAVWTVGALTLAGIATLWVLTGNIAAALFTPYGQFFVLKLALFLAVLGLAAWNKLRLTPALLRGETSASKRLRHSIRLEAALIAAIFAVTAALTTVSAPMSNNQGAAAGGFAQPEARSSVTS